MQNYQRGVPTAGSGAVGPHSPKNTHQSRYSPIKDTPISIKYERIPPIKPGPHPPNTAKATARSKEYTVPGSRTALRDFVFGFVVGLLVFGIAAFIVCSALLKLI